MLYLRLALVDTRYAILWGVLKDSLLGLIRGLACRIDDSTTG